MVTTGPVFLAAVLPSSGGRGRYRRKVSRTRCACRAAARLQSGNQSRPRVLQRCADVGGPEAAPVPSHAPDSFILEVGRETRPPRPPARAVARPACPFPRLPSQSVRCSPRRVLDPRRPAAARQPRAPCRRHHRAAHEERFQVLLRPARDAQFHWPHGRRAPTHRRRPLRPAAAGSDRRPPRRRRHRNPVRHWRHPTSAPNASISDTRSTSRGIPRSGSDPDAGSVQPRRLIPCAIRRP